MPLSGDQEEAEGDEEEDQDEDEDEDEEGEHGEEEDPDADDIDDDDQDILDSGVWHPWLRGCQVGEWSGVPGIKVSGLECTVTHVVCFDSYLVWTLQTSKPAAVLG